MTVPDCLFKVGSFAGLMTFCLAIALLFAGYQSAVAQTAECSTLPKASD
jgi:hypothetical protein